MTRTGTVMNNSTFHSIILCFAISFSATACDPSSTEVGTEEVDTTQLGNPDARDGSVEFCDAALQRDGVTEASASEGTIFVSLDNVHADCTPAGLRICSGSVNPNSDDETAGEIFAWVSPIDDACGLDNTDPQLGEFWLEFDMGPWLVQAADKGFERVTVTVDGGEPRPFEVFVEG